MSDENEVKTEPSETEENFGDTPLADDKVRYLITDNNGEFIIEIPKYWKVTFSTVNPASNSGGRDYCVRVWEKKEVLRAVYPNVKGIRDLSIPLARKVNVQTGSATWMSDSAGNFETNRKVEVATQLVEDNLNF